VRFSDVRHQERALSIVRRALASGRAHHAYLFDGPEGVGKEMAARALAAKLLCQAADRSPEDDACCECSSCKLFASDNHPDFHLIHRELHKRHPDKAIRSSKGLFLAVDVIRHFLIEPASSAPSQGMRRVFLIRDAERMNEGAQNALLKTLEEPPGDARLILVTSTAGRMLPTIRSRCQRIPFDLLPQQFVEERIRELAGVEPTAARILAGLAQGRLGAALQWHKIGLLTSAAQIAQTLAGGTAFKPEAFGKTLIEIAQELAVRTIEETEHFAFEVEEDDNGDASKSVAVEKIGPDQLRPALKLVFLLIAAIYRDALTTRANADPALRVTSPGNAAVNALIERFTADQLGECIRMIAVAERMLDRNVSPQLTCEHLAPGLTGELSSMA